MKYKQFILFVEDDEVIGAETVKMMEEFLAHNQYGLIWSRNGIEALKQYKKHKSWFGFKQNKIKCILLDLRMPEMDGVQFVSKLRQIEKSNIFAQFVPVVFISAWEDQEKWESALDNYVASYIKKPIKKDDLITTLSKIIHYHDAEELESIMHKKGLEKLTEYFSQEKEEQQIKNSN